MDGALPRALLSTLMPPLCPPALPASTSSPARSLPSCHTVLDTSVQCPAASGLGDCTPMSHVRFLRCPLLSVQCWGRGSGFGPGSSGSSSPAGSLSSLVSEGGSLVCWKVSSFSPPPLCQPSPYLRGPLWRRGIVPSLSRLPEWGAWAPGALGAAVSQGNVYGEGFS